MFLLLFLLEDWSMGLAMMRPNRSRLC